MAGGWIAYGIWSHFHFIPLFSLLIASACFYAMGIALNDYMDYPLDKLERPERPLPSGRIARSNALTLICILGMSGLVITFFVHWVSFFIACTLVALICLYDTFLKKHYLFGPICMGSCRGLNLLLGISLLPSQLPKFWWISFIGLVYISVVTALARGEVGDALYPKRVWMMSFAILVCSVAVMCLGRGDTLLATFITVSVFFLWTFRGIYPSLKKPDAVHIRKAVGTCIIGLPLLDAAIATTFGGMTAWLTVFAFMLISYAWSHVFSVT